LRLTPVHKSRLKIKDMKLCHINAKASAAALDLFPEGREPGPRLSRPKNDFL
jgi:hypothetical protein